MATYFIRLIRLVHFRLVEEFLHHQPELINMNGSEINLSLLHFAAVRDKLEVADFLLKQVCLFYP